MREMKRRVRVPAGFGLLIFALVAAYYLHWAATCVGREGEFHLSESRRLLGFGLSWGHTRALVWAEPGEEIVLQYDVRMAGGGNVGFRSGKWKPLWARGHERWKWVTVRRSGSGTLSYIVAESGIHELHRSRYSPWKSEATLKWMVR